MSEYEFGVEDEMGEPSGQQDQGPKWFREQMAKVSADIKSLREENETLRAERARTQVRDALTAKGFASQVADLYTGTPDKLDDWLSTYGAGLAKTGETAGEAGQGVQGTPQSSVSAENQAAMAKMAAAGQEGSSAVLGGEEQLVARLKSANSLEELEAIEREQGSRYV